MRVDRSTNQSRSDQANNDRPTLRTVPAKCPEISRPGEATSRDVTRRVPCTGRWLFRAAREVPSVQRVRRAGWSEEFDRERRRARRCRLHTTTSARRCEMRHQSEGRGHDVACAGFDEQIEPCIGIEVLRAEKRDEVLVAELCEWAVGCDLMLVRWIAWDIHVAGIPFVSECRNRIDAPVQEDAELGIAKPRRGLIRRE